MKLRTRLQRLEQTVGIDRGCPGCRPRHGLSITVFSEENDDGTVTEPQGMPTPCEHCAEIPERIVHVIESVLKDTTEDLFDEVADLNSAVLIE